MKELNIAHLFPDLLNLYGDRGNIMSLFLRAKWRGIHVNVVKCNDSSDIDFKKFDIVFLGGGSDREQVIVGDKLLEMKSDLEEFVNSNGVILAVCGGYQLLGHYYQSNVGKVDGLGILDIYTDSEEGRLIGNVLIEPDSSIIDSTIVGFENHGGRTYINDHSPLGRVIKGYGNNSKDKGEGVIYKNVIGTYIHGPLLPKNPKLTDYILKQALLRKYGDDFEALIEIDDTAENNAHDYMKNRLLED